MTPSINPWISTMTASLVRLCHVVLPLDVVIRMHADFKPTIPDIAHDRTASPRNMRGGQQGSIQQRPEAIVFQHGGAAHLAHETAAEGAFDGAPGLIRTQAEQKRGPHVQPLEQAGQPRDPFQGAAIRIHVDFERNPQNN